MAFSQVDYVQVLKFLGYQPTPEARGMAAQRISTTTGGIVELEALIKDELRELVKIQDDLDGARLGAGRSFNSGGAATVQFFRGDRLSELRAHGRQHVAYLADMTGMAIARDVFAGSSRGANHGQVVRG
jgi:hypothetical protein